MYALSDKGSKVLKNFEGLRLHVYYCAAGKLTIGYGHRHQPGEPLSITKLEADSYFENDTNRVLNELWNEIKSLKQYEVDALTSFIYNIGIGAWRTSTARELLIKGSDRAVPQELRRWIHDDHGHVITGLVNRRYKESKMFEGKEG